MRKVAVQFKIKDELFTTHGNKNTKADIAESVLQRLRNRSADFDKLVEDDGDGNIEDQLHDQDYESDVAVTFVDITMSVDDAALEALENDPDLMFVKAISVLQNGDVKLKGDTVQNNVAHISFS